MRILVADQNTLLLAAITATFGPHCDLVTASRRDVCLAQLEQHKFDVIIACDKLSDYTGLELLSEVPVISPDTLLIFAANPKRLNQLGKRLAVFGLFDTLSYPLTPQKLVEVLKRARERLRAARGQQAAHNSPASVPDGLTGQHDGAAGQPGGPTGQHNGHAGQPGGPIGQHSGHAGQPGGLMGQHGGPGGQPKVRHVVLESEWDTGERLGLMARELQAELAAKGRTATHDEWSRAAEAGAAAEDGSSGEDDFVFEGPPPSVQAMAEPTRDDGRATQAGDAVDGSPAGVPEGARGGGVSASNRNSAGRTFEGTPVASRPSTRTGASGAPRTNGVIEYEVKPPEDLGATRPRRSKGEPPRNSGTSQQTRSQVSPSAVPEASRLTGSEARRSSDPWTVGQISGEITPASDTGKGLRTRGESVLALTYESGPVEGDGADDFVFAAQPEPIGAPGTVGMAVATDAGAVVVASETVAYAAELDATTAVEAESVIDVEPAGAPVAKEPSIDDLCGNDPVFEAPSWGPDEAANELAFEAKPVTPGSWRRGGTGGTPGSARGTAGGAQSGGGYESRGRYGSAAGSSASSSRSGSPVKASRTHDDSRSGHGSGSRSRGYNDAHPFGGSQASNTSRSAHAPPAAPTTPHSAYVYPESPNASHSAYAYPAPNTQHPRHAYQAAPNTTHSAAGYPVARNTQRPAHAYPAAPNTSHSGHASPAAPNAPHSGHPYPAAPNTQHPAHAYPAAPGTSNSAHASPAATNTSHSAQARPGVPNSGRQSAKSGKSHASALAAQGNGSPGTNAARSARGSGSQAHGAASDEATQAGEARTSASSRAAQAGEAHPSSANGATQAGVARASASKGAAQAGAAQASSANGARAGEPRTPASKGGAQAGDAHASAVDGATQAGVARASASRGAAQAEAAQASSANGAGQAAVAQDRKAARAGERKGSQRRERAPSVPSASQLAAFERAMARRQAERAAGEEIGGAPNRMGRKAAKGVVKVEPTIGFGQIHFGSGAASDRPSASLSDLAKMATKKRPLAVPSFNGIKAGPNRTAFAVGSGVAAVLILGVLSFELLRNSHEAEHHMPHAQAQSMQVFSSSTTLVANREGSGVAQLVAPPPPEQTAQPEAQASLPQAETFDADAAPPDPPPPPALEHPGPMEPPSMGNDGPPTGMMPDSDGSSE